MAKQIQSRRERRKSGNFKPIYNGARYRAVHTLVMDEEKPYKLKLVTKYEKIEE